MDERRLMIVSHEIPRRSRSMQFSSPVNVDGSFSYDRIPSETLNLSILKLNASSFRVEVANAATVADLKQAVEAVFCHMPQKGPGKILWPLVWRQFCLCYQGHKLVTETDYIRDYGIKDGDQLHFVHHLSDTCSFQRKQSKKQVVNLKQHRRRCRSSSQVNRYQQKEHNDDDDIGLDDIVIENGKIQHCNAEENRGGKSRLGGFLGGFFSPTWLAVVRRARIEGRICCSMVARSIVSSFRKIRRILSYCRRQHYSRRPTWREY
ncbi:U11/U12 small nuclear ribonucleoprotein 25 kDa protein [Spatholobus suberectus]|nr:U11/U12 small nuclear ribonucleoprotein 25 kDa protein [Spatholobus suberectus]